jgi:DNA (cytosine-5)-methyltransferase 1
MSDTTEKTFAEFFAGIGLMRMGLERAGWRIAFANDIDEDKWAMYRQHFGDTGEFVLGDVHHLDASAIPNVALATASFPCNDLSLAGARKGLAGEQSSAFWGFVEVLTSVGSASQPPGAFSQCN